MKEEFTKMTPLGHYAYNTDIAQMALFLASDRSEFITGSTNVVEGGFTAWIQPNLNSNNCFAINRRFLVVGKRNSYRRTRNEALYFGLYFTEKIDSIGQIDVGFHPPIIYLDFQPN